MGVNSLALMFAKIACKSNYDRDRNGMFPIAEETIVIEGKDRKKYDMDVMKTRLPHFKNHKVPSSQRFRIVWTIQNTGADRWPADTRAVFLAGHYLSQVSSIPVDAIAPGEYCKVTVQLESPRPEEIQKEHDISMVLNCITCNPPAGRFGTEMHACVTVEEPTDHRPWIEE